MQLSIVRLLVTALCATGLTFLVVLTPASAAEGTPVGGTLTQDTTWTASGSPYKVWAEVVVPEGITLTIEPGVTVVRSVETYKSNMLRIQGDLIAGSAGADLVVFDAVGYDTIFRGAPGSTAQTATGQLELRHVRLIGRGMSGSSGTFASVTVLGSRLGDIDFQSVHRLRLERNAIVMGSNTTSRLVIGVADEATEISHNRLRGVRLVCSGGALTLRNNTFEAMSPDAWEDGSGVEATSSCARVDASGNYWESDGDLGSRILDGMDQEGRPIVQVGDRLQSPTELTATLPPSWPGWSMNVEARSTGLTGWWGVGSTGGAAVTYTVEALPEGEWTAEQTVETTSNVAAIRHLDTSRRYRLRVTAHNAAGTGWQLLSNPVYPVATASVPSKPEVLVTRTARGARLSWSSLSNGGDPIWFYQWELTGPDGLVEGSGGPDTVREYGDLRVGGSYEFLVYAVNGIGASEQASTTFVVADVPGRARDVVAEPRSAGAVVKWAAAAARGAAVSGYRVVASPGGARVKVGPEAGKARFRGLRPGRKYEFRVYAANEIGTGVPGVSNRVRVR